MVEPIADDSELMPDGKLDPGIDMPPEAFAPTADALTDEVDPPLDIVDKGFGPVDLPGAEPDDTDPLDDEGAVDDEPPTKPEGTDEPPPADASSEGDDVKQDPETVPYDRFQEVVHENQQLRQAQQILDWIKQNPEQAAARLGGRPQAPTAQPTSEVERLAVGLQEPTPQKPLEDMDETERAQLWVEKSSYNYLKEPLEQVTSKVNELLSFKEKLEETLTKNAVDAEGKPLHPRWDELKGTMTEVKARYAGISDGEAYVLADRMIPQSTPMGNEMGAYNQNQPPPASPPATPPPAASPKRAKPGAMRAARVASFGRSSPGMTAADPERMSAEQAASKAFDDVLQES